MGVLVTTARRIATTNQAILFGSAGVLLCILTIGVMIARAPVAGDKWVIRLFQDIPGLVGMSTLVNHMDALQAPILAVGAAGVILASRTHHQRLATLIAALVCLMLLPLNAELKTLVESPRPTPADGVSVLESPASYGFPSGHTSGATIVAGMLAMGLWRTGTRAAQVAACAVLLWPVVAGPARLVVGAHWPSDVAGGYLVGILVVIGANMVAVSAAHRFAPRPADARA
jgi:membrane-associated phospholipid phosphatase